MGQIARKQLRCSICQVTATVAYDSDLGKLTVELEHLDDDVHNIVPFRDGVRGHPAILLDPDLEQSVDAWQLP